MVKKFIILYVMFSMTCCALLSQQDSQILTNLNRYVEFSFDTLLFGKIPSIFVQTQGYSDEESFKLLTENLVKNRSNDIFLIEDLNLILKIESLNFEDSQPKILEKLRKFYGKESAFILLYLDFFESLLKRDEKAVKANIDRLSHFKTQELEQNLIIGLISYFFNDDKTFLEKAMLEITKSIAKEVYTNYICGKIALFILNNESLAMIFWKAALVDSTQELKERVPSILLKNIENYWKSRGKEEKSFEVEKFYLELKIWSDPGNPVWLNNLGYFLGEAGDYEKALEYCQKAVSIKPEEPYFLDSLGWVQFKSGKIPEGISNLEKAISLKPDFYEALYHLSTIYYADGDFKKAESLLRKAIAADGKQPVAKNDLGYILIDTDKDYSEGINYVKEALLKDPNNPFFLDSLGWGLHKIGRFGESAEFLMRSYTARPLYDNMLHLSTTLVAMGLFEKARKILAENYKRWPRSDQLVEMIGVINLLINLEARIRTESEEKKQNYYQLLLGNLYAGLNLPFHAYMVLKNIYTNYPSNHAISRLKKVLGTKIVERYFKGHSEYPLAYLGRLPLMKLFYVYCGIFEKDLFRLLNFDELIKSPESKTENQFRPSFVDLYTFKTKDSNELVMSWLLPPERITQLLLSLLSDSKYIQSMVFGNKFELDLFRLIKVRFFPVGNGLVVGSVSEGFEKVYASNYVVSGIVENLKDFYREYLLDIPVRWICRIFDNPFSRNLQSARLTTMTKEEKGPKVSACFEFTFDQDKVNKKIYCDKLNLKVAMLKKVFSGEVQVTNFFKEGRNASGITVNVHTLTATLDPSKISAAEIRTLLGTERNFEKFYLVLKEYFKDLIGRMTRK